MDAPISMQVAKWVHATPLPAKISEAQLFSCSEVVIHWTSRSESEARLYSLEARLADEMDARPDVLVFPPRVAEQSPHALQACPGEQGRPWR